VVRGAGFEPTPIAWLGLPHSPSYATHARWILRLSVVDYWVASLSKFVFSSS
jgi:hypothetical protein